jgi:hypothetical protein
MDPEATTLGCELSSEPVQIFPGNRYATAAWRDPEAGKLSTVDTTVPPRLRNR